ncbi:MAG: hypothetical protein MI924_25690, partial [Chloroflexales bacterium]|nr:hypothetical protein [Chloroflexales bacterium]
MSNQCDLNYEQFSARNRAVFLPIGKCAVLFHICKPALRIQEYAQREAVVLFHRPATVMEQSMTIYWVRTEKN